MMKEPSPRDGDDVRVRVGQLGAHAGGQAVAHRAQTARGQMRLRASEAAMLGRPHLVLAHVAGGDELIAGCFGQFLQQGRRVDAVARRVVARGAIAALSRAQRVDPGVDQRRAAGQSAEQHALQVAGDGDVGVAQLADFGGVDVEMDDARMRRERRPACRWRGHRSARPARSADRMSCTASLAARVPCMPSMPRNARRVGRQRRPGLAASRPRGCRSRAAKARSASTASAMRDAAADIEQRPLGRADRGLGRARSCAGRSGAPRRSDGGARGAVAVGDADLHVLGQVDQHRAGATRRRRREKLPRQMAGMSAGSRDDPGVLHDRQGDAEDVDLLKCIGAHQGRGDVAGDARPSAPNPSSHWRCR